MASMLYFNGVDSVSLSKRLGRAQVSTTASIYAHVMAEADQKNSRHSGGRIPEEGLNFRSELN